jgi:hypothetical protein
MDISGLGSIGKAHLAITAHVAFAPTGDQLIKPSDLGIACGQVVLTIDHTFEIASSITGEPRSAMGFFAMLRASA